MDKQPTEIELQSDEWFINNVAGLAQAELAVATKQGRRIDITGVRDFIDRYRPAEADQEGE